MLEIKALRLLNFLLEHPEDSFNQQEICHNVRWDNGDMMFKWTDDIRNHCPSIWDAVNEINNDPDCPYVVSYINYTVKLCDEVDAQELLLKRWNELAKRLKRYHYLCKKIGMNHQIDLLGHKVCDLLQAEETEMIEMEESLLELDDDELFGDPAILSDEERKKLG